MTPASTPQTGKSRSGVSSSARRRAPLTSSAAASETPAAARIPKDWTATGPICNGGVRKDGVNPSIDVATPDPIQTERRGGGGSPPPPPPPPPTSDAPPHHQTRHLAGPARRT